MKYLQPDKNFGYRVNAVVTELVTSIKVNQERLVYINIFKQENDF